ncbi:MAG: hypothetical protein HBSAPP04_27220 [Ignavibacteriaceae bacterium]|nr:MAG: hypothetical protein HBSAPP04_27220 [Ignavibacteriaceae bacterium]
MSNIAYLTYPEFILAHVKYEMWVAGYDPYLKKTACDMFNSYMHKLSEVVMPQKKQQNNDNNRQNWTKVEFVNINLSKSEKTQFKSWYADNQAELPMLLTAFLSAGYKTSMKYDFENSCFIVTAICEDDGLPNHGKALTSRSDDWLEALALNLFKTDVLSPDGVWETSGKGNSWG